MGAVRSFCLLIAINLPSVAVGQMMVIGESKAAACYQAVESGIKNNKQTEMLCTEAIKAGRVSRADLLSTYVNRGVVRMRQGNFDNAREDFLYALQRDANNPETLINLGAVQIYQGEYALAIESLNKALAFETRKPHAAHYNLALAYEAADDLQSAYESFKRAKALQPEWALVDKQLERFIIEIKTSE